MEDNISIDLAEILKIEPNDGLQHYMGWNFRWLTSVMMTATLWILSQEQYVFCFWAFPEIHANSQSWLAVPWSFPRIHQPEMF
jgi:hypothetical protein